MRITSPGSPNAPAAVARAAEVDNVDNAAAPAAAPAAAAPLQSAVLAPALAALRAMPDIDHAKVALLRDALAKGELPFDPAKLAGLIQRFHGGGK